MTLSAFYATRRSQARALIMGIACSLMAALPTTAANITEKQRQALGDYTQIIEDLKLTGMSVVIVDNYEIVHAQAVGLKEFGTNDKVDIDTAFSTASISKAVTGTIAVMLAEKGVLNLDAPVSAYLKRWQLPESDFTKSTPITLRHLFSHTAGTSQSGFADFYPGDDIPTILDSLNGIKLRRYDKPIEIMWAPGSRFKYSGGGFVIAQVAMEDATGKSLAQLAKEMLFEPLGMTNSSMEQVGHPDFPQNVAKAHNLEQKLVGPGGVLINPQIAAGGLWSSANDMAKLVIDLQKALAGKPTKVISPWAAKTATQIETLHKAGGWGLGWARYLGDGNLDWFSHLGYNTGIGGNVMGTMEGGRAIIAFGNGVHRVRVPALDKVVENAISALGWKKDIAARTEAPDPTLIEQLTGSYESLNTGYWSPLHVAATIKQVDGKLLLDNSLSTHKPRELLYVGNGRFRADEFSASDISVSANPADGKTYLTFYREGTDLHSYPMRKLAEGETLPFEVANTQDFGRTLAAYQKKKAQSPKSSMLRPRTLRGAGKRALELGNHKAALNFYKIYTAFYPDDAKAHEGLARVYLATGKQEDAKTAILKSLSLEPGNEEAQKIAAKLGL